MKTIVAPSLLAADFTCLERDIEMVNGSEADWLHLDVMDGRFVPNITFGMLIVEAAKEICEKPLDVHLMIVEPEKYIEEFRAAGADLICVHYEACPNLHRTIQQIQNTGAKAGVAINPHTPVSLLADVIEDVDLVNIMSVNPGFGGQSFIYRSLAKIRALKEMIISRNSTALIEVDGGVGLQNAEQIVKAGANVLVAGSSIFSAEEPAAMISKLKRVRSDTMLT